MGGVGGCGQGRGTSVAGKAGVWRGALGKSQKVYRVSGATPKSYRLEPSFSAFVVFQAIRFGDTIFDTIWGLPVSIDTISDTIPAQPRRTDTISDTIPAQPRRTDMISDTIPAQPRQMDTISRFWQGCGGVGWGWDRGVYCILCDCACQASRRKNAGTVGQVCEAIWVNRCPCQNILTCVSVHCTTVSSVSKPY